MSSIIPLKSNNFRLSFSFRPKEDGPIAREDQDSVLKLKQCAHNEFKITLAITNQNAADLLSLSRHSHILIRNLDLFDVDSQVSVPVVSNQLFTVENLKLSPLTYNKLRGSNLTITLHLFAYHGVDYEKLIPFYL